MKPIQIYILGAEWCPHCKPQYELLRSLESEKVGVKYVYKDDEREAIDKKFGLEYTSIPYTIITINNELRKWCTDKSPIGLVGYNARHLDVAKKTIEKLKKEL